MKNIAVGNSNRRESSRSRGEIRTSLRSRANKLRRISGPVVCWMAKFAARYIWSDTFVEQQIIVDLQNLLSLTFVCRHLSMTTKVDKMVLCQKGMRYSTVEAIVRTTCLDMDKQI